jgi:hypothetical protein
LGWKLGKAKVHDKEQGEGRSCVVHCKNRVEGASCHGLRQLMRCGVCGCEEVRGEVRERKGRVCQVYRGAGAPGSAYKSAWRREEVRGRHAEGLCWRQRVRRGVMWRVGAESAWKSVWPKK